MRHFSFGKNWDNFQKVMTPEREMLAAKHTLGFLNDVFVKDKTVLDIGCGSGLFSLVFFRGGARKIVSFDYDSKAVDCTCRFRDRHGSPANWHVLHGDILNDKFIDSLGRFDIVYAWGSLHHTRNMYKAFENAIKCVNKGGVICLSIYNKILGRNINSSSFWVREKKLFNSCPFFIQRLILYSFVIYRILVMITRFQNPYRIIKGYYKKRGMDWRVDLLDWLGGYPYEYASVDEVFKFFHEKGFNLINIKATTSLGNNEYLFKKI